MSHQTNIGFDGELTAFLKNVNSSKAKIRLFKVQINETKEVLQLAENGVCDIVGKRWQDDYATNIRKLITNENDPCYLLVRLDSEKNGFNDWAFILYSPDRSHVRKKMLYASTKFSLKNWFGSSVSFDYLANSLEDLSLSSFEAWIQDKLSSNYDDDDDDGEYQSSNIEGDFYRSERKDDLLTNLEDERLKVKNLEFERSLEVNNEKKASRFQFPLHDSTKSSLKQLGLGKLVYLKLKVDLTTEQIVADRKSTASDWPTLSKVFDPQNSKDLEKILLPTDDENKRDSGYHLFCLSYLDPTKSNNEIIKRFILAFVMNPDYTSVKQRISYSACLNSLIDLINSSGDGVKIDRRLETDDITMITFDHILYKLHPHLDKNNRAFDVSNGQNEATSDPSSFKFEKPRGPPSRGPRRIIK